MTSPNSYNPQKQPRKPIYDDLVPLPASPSKQAPSETQQPTSNPSSDATARAPTPTDRLATQVRAVRLHLYNYSQSGETAFNNLMVRVFHLESSLSSTVASLAPPPSANEALLPGAIYILVASLSGSILTRNRGILLRVTVPLTFGLAAAYAVVPATMENVGELVWRYEERYPEVAKTHLRVRERVETIWETGKAHSTMTLQRGEEAVDEGRRKVEEWVGKGK